MRTRLGLLLFSLLALLQLSAVLGMIGWREAVLHFGTQYKFQTAPVDPYDALRGRYVALQMQQESFRAAEFSPNQRIYVSITDDASGFATISAINSSKPRAGAYIRAHAGYSQEGVSTVRWPFDRYYMQEDLAPRAESAYRQHSRRDNLNAYITVRVWHGYAALDELYINGLPIYEYLSSER